jgi:hypothetical protein
LVDRVEGGSPRPLPHHRACGPRIRWFIRQAAVGAIGKLTGQLVYPSGGVLFTDYTEEVSIPVRIRLASQSSFRWSGGGLPFHGFAWADVALASVSSRWP